jgi:flavin reductase ActVB
MDLAVFKEAMSRFPSGVVVVTTRDTDGRCWGFTASSFSSISMEPPLILVSLAKEADCHHVFGAAPWFAISILRAGHEPLAVNFATRGVDKFAAGQFATDEHGSPLLSTAAATMTCQRYEVYDCGDHSLMVGRVTEVGLGSDGDPMIYVGRRFARLSPDCA